VNRRTATILIAASAAILLLALAFALRARRARPPAATAPSGTAPAPAVEAAAAWPATLWLPSESERLAPAEVEVSSGSEPEARAGALVAALLARRPEPPLDALFPGEVALGRLLVTGGTAFVDLRPADGAADPPSAGSNLELLRVYSIVHTLARNVPEIERVVLLWNGTQRAGFPGHVDTGHPLVPIAGLEGE
jgi:hypothetical protein